MTKVSTFDLQNSSADSSAGSDYDPEGDVPPGDDDDVIPSSGEEGEPSDPKKPRLDPPPQDQHADSDSD